MATNNLSLSAAWTKVAEPADASVLITWNGNAVVEVATTSDDAEPTVNGHEINSGEAITRNVLGAGHIWMRTKSGSYNKSINLVVTK